MLARRLVHQVRDPAVAIAADGRVLHANSAVEDVLGVPSAALAGESCADVVTRLNPGGAPLCMLEGCPTLDAVGLGNAAAIPWCHGHSTGTQWLDGTVITMPTDERADGSAAVIILRVVDSHRTPVLGDPFLLQLLGNVGLTRRGAAVVPSRRRAIELLALLATSRGGLHRDEIVEALWPQASADDGRNHLRVLVHSLRRVMEEQGAAGARDLIAWEGAHYLLREDPRLQVDVAEFDRRAAVQLRRAADAGGACRPEELGEMDAVLALYVGPFGAGADFGAWAIPVRERLQSQYLRLLTAAAQCAAHAGDVERLIRYCEAAVSVDPAGEEFQFALFVGYTHSGRRAEAVRRYEEYRDFLAREYHLMPSNAFQRAFREAV